MPLLFSSCYYRLLHLCHLNICMVKGRRIYNCRRLLGKVSKYPSECLNIPNTPLILNGLPRGRRKLLHVVVVFRATHSRYGVVFLPLLCEIIRRLRLIVAGRFFLETRS